MIKGTNIFLRAVELEDARIISAWLNDRETNKYLDITYPLSKRYADSYVYDTDEDKSKKTFIIDNPDRKPIGLVVIENIKWEYRNCEVGIVIYDKNQRGKGYGKDALETVVNFIFNEMNMHLAYLNVFEENEAAIKLYKSVGFDVEGVLRQRYYKEGKYKNVIVMSKIKAIR
jgi:diamine N-acetyltransferase